MLSLSLSTSSAHHGVLIFAILLILLLLWIEARRYRFFDVYRTRARQLDGIISPSCSAAAGSLRQLAGDPGRKPEDAKIPHSHWTAFAGHRRNYIHMFAILLFAVLKISTPSLQNQATGSGGFVHTAAEAVSNANFGPLPGWLLWLRSPRSTFAFLIAFTMGRADAYVAEGDVHVDEHPVSLKARPASAPEQRR